MFVITTQGAFYVSKHRHDAELVLVRTRCRRHMTALASEYRRQVGHRLAWKHTPDADFPYRAAIRAIDWICLVTTWAGSVDYPSFKAACFERLGPEYERFVVACWQASFRLEDWKARRAVL